jgi:ubiquinol-cytochrome c reductase iron-sulfur subunit
MKRQDSQRPARRDVLVIGAGAFVAVGTAFAGWPFVAQMAPNPGTPAPEMADIDIGAVAPGQSIVVAWRNMPVIVRCRTAREIELSRAVDLSRLSDRAARNPALASNAPATDANRVLAEWPQWLVVVGVCTREGCRISTLPTEATEAEAFICPCCASRYDTAGRIRSGPAPRNLEVPPRRLLAPGRLRIGEVRAS